jgi:chemotaxis protein MotB
MAKSKLDPGSEAPSDGASWLMSYADMMTLICCFFILMMAFANYDPVGFTKKTVEVSKHFNKDKYKSSDTKFQNLQEEIARHPELQNKLKTSVDENELIVTFSGSALFEDESYELTDQMRLTLDALIDLIKIKDSNFKVLVEGHTDNQPISKDSPFSSNWGLSGARAAAIVHRFEYFGFDPKNLVSIGHGDTKPIVPNEDDKGDPIPENVKLNRRVVIKVLEPKTSAPVKMGFGVYFDDGVVSPQ